MSQQQNKPHFWLRHEIKEGECRTPLLPSHCQTLIDQGHLVTVEKSTTRCVKDEEYAAVGCTLVEAGSWASAPRWVTVVGLKELPENGMPLYHNHIYFAHCYKGQSGAKELLSRFKEGNGTLWDLEFLTHDNGRRVAAFGRAAGIVGMAIGLFVWSYRQLDPSKPCRPFLERYQTYDELASAVSEVLAQAKQKAGYLPKPIVIGALGRCGGGSCDFATKLGLEVTKWDLEETKGGGPFPIILNHHIFVNCIYLMSKIPSFVTTDLLQQQQDRKLSVIVDVSCDATNPNNPVPVYNDITTFLKPTIRILEKTDNPIDVVAIDHLPSLVPAESSKEFDDSLIEHLLTYPSSPVWKRAEDLFRQKLVSVLNQ